MKKLIHPFFVLIFVLLKSQLIYSQETLTASIDKLLMAELKSNEPGGVVLVSRKGEVIYKKAFGMANMELGVPIKEDMIFYIGSNTKQFTAVAVLQLFEQGKLRLKDSIGKYISCPLPAAAVTIQQLLSHTSGLAENAEATTSKNTAAEGKEITQEERCIPHLRAPMDFPAGTEWKYNNVNFQLLGVVIEKITGKPYATYLEENILKPAGMLTTGMYHETPIVKNRAPGYLNFRMGIQNVKPNTVSTLYASGGLQSTVEDMFKWNRALQNGKLLKKETLTKAHTPQKLISGRSTTYGFGWHLETLNGSPTIRHGGLVRGFASETLFLPDEDVYVVILTNAESRVPITALSRIIAGIAINKPYSFSEVALDKNTLQSYQGLYQNEHDELINITNIDDKLYFQRPGGVRYPIRAADKNRFFFDRDYLWIEFQAEEQKRVNGLTFSKVGILPTQWKKTDKPTLALYPERLPDNLVSQYIGVYKLSEKDSVIIKKEGAGIILQLPGKEKQSLIANTEQSFSTLKENISVEFQRTTETTYNLMLFQENRKKLAIKVK